MTQRWYLLMLVEVGAVSEGARAVRAAVRALPGVAARVFVQRPALPERAPALHAPVHARRAPAPPRPPRDARAPPTTRGTRTCKPIHLLLTRVMSAYMQAVLAGRGELARTLRALERLLSRVDTLVFREVTFLTETLAADITCYLAVVGPVLRVHELVSLQELPVLEALPALVADVALSRVLRLLVVHHRRRVFYKTKQQCYLPAEIAGVPLGRSGAMPAMADGMECQRARVRKPRAALRACVRTLALFRKGLKKNIKTYSPTSLTSLSAIGLEISILGFAVLWESLALTSLSTTISCGSRSGKELATGYNVMSSVSDFTLMVVET
ncbi:hypothetical protein HW555_007146 [Spodoptera exigua]|uniref:Uncharacterized protein n=1 Tax=Spodoptera exigua TaxID=7107 RepID=A0A835GHM7_SPOEX|nr:hypothetical protein HW555_007146 [Spodoptera exigua]